MTDLTIKGIRALGQVQPAATIYYRIYEQIERLTDFVIRMGKDLHKFETD